MTVQPTDIKIYGSAVMPEDDTVTEIGGAIDMTRRVVFTDIEPAGTVEALSSDATDNQTLTVTGLDAGGVVITEDLVLNGTTAVGGAKTFKSLLKARLSAAAAGTVTLREPAAESLMVFAPGEVEIRRVFYRAAVDTEGGTTRTYYEKVFFRNNHATSALTSAQISELADPENVIAFALEGTLDGTGTNGAGNNRLVAPTGFAFDSAAKPVANSQNHLAGQAQGCWLALTLTSDKTTNRTTYTLRESGITE